MPKGFKHTEETKKKMRLAKLGKVGYWRGKKRKLSTKKKLSETHKKIGTKPPSNLGKIFSKKTREKMSKARSGCKNWNWKGGITPKMVVIRTSSIYKLWRKSIFTRDKFTCQKYGIIGGELEAHHIYNFRDFPELRFAIDNGITLSKKAHKEFHSIYGKNNNTPEQLKEFLNS